MRNYARPEVRYVQEDGLKVQKSGIYTQVREIRTAQGTTPLQWNYISYTKLSDFEILRNPTTTDYHSIGRRQLAITPAGGNQGAATQLTKYYNEATTLTVTTNDAVKLFAAPTVGDCILVINNHASVSLKVYPQTGAAIDALGTNNNFTIAPGSMAFFVYTDTNIWQSAVDNGR